jgi:hypothetical protein
VVPGVHFIGRETKRSGWEVGGQAPANGAPLTYWLHEEEMMRWPFDEGEMKRRRRCVGSLARRVALVLEAAATARIRFGDGSIGREVGDEGGSSWVKLGRVTWRLGPVLERKKTWTERRSGPNREGAAENSFHIFSGF